MELIDVHSHIVPERFPDNPSPATNSRWPCMHSKNATDATVMIGDKPFREIDSRSWDVARRIEDMDRDRVTMQALSPMPELLSYWFTPSDGLEMARWMNHTIAAMVARSAESFRRPRHRAAAGSRARRRRTRSPEARRLQRRRDRQQRQRRGAGRRALRRVLRGSRTTRTRSVRPRAASDRRRPIAGISRSDSVRRVSARHGAHCNFVDARGCAGTSSELARRFQPRRRRDRAADAPVDAGLERHARFWRRDAATAEVLRASVSSTTASCTSRVICGISLQDFAPGQIFGGTDYPYAIMETRLHDFLSHSESAVRASLFNGAARRFLGLHKG